MFRHTILRLTLAACLALAAGLALASGSDGGGTAETGRTAIYNMGKRVYATKLACDTCSMAGKRLDAAAARELFAKPPGVTLADEESKALEFYLKRRFKL